MVSLGARAQETDEPDGNNKGNLPGEAGRNDKGEILVSRRVSA